MAWQHTPTRGPSTTEAASEEAAPSTEGHPSSAVSPLSVQRKRWPRFRGKAHQSDACDHTTCPLYSDEQERPA